MKVNSTIYKGIEYVQVNALPAEQKERLLQTINKDLFIKILVDGKLVGNCIQFKDYEIWFENIYKAEKGRTQPTTRNENVTPTEVPVENLKKR